MAVIPGLGRQRKEDLKVEASLEATMVDLKTGLRQSGSTLSYFSLNST
jgi:hypothetical protein